MIWGYGRNELENFINPANKLHPTIKFSSTINNQEIPFLDTVIYRGKNNYILTKLYNKPIDHKQYLYFNSADPWKQKKSVPYGILIRCKRLCSEEKYFEEDARIILYKLTTRKYPIQLLYEPLDKVSKMDKLQLLKETTKKESNKIGLITYYNPTNLHQILQEHKGLLLMTMKEAIKPENIQVKYSRSPNLKDVLIQGSLETPNNQEAPHPLGNQNIKHVTIYTKE